MLALRRTVCLTVGVILVVVAEACAGPVSGGSADEVGLPVIDLKVYSTELNACLAERGFVALPDPAGGYTFRVGEQFDAFQEATTVCNRQLTEAGILSDVQQLSERQLVVLYRLALGINDCLAEHGYPVSPPPSEDKFVESGGRVWNPCDVASSSEIDGLLEVCPYPLVAQSGE